MASRRDFIKGAGAITALPMAQSLIGCGTDEGETADAGVADADLPDAGSGDSGGTPDTAVEDTAEPFEPLPGYEYEGPMGPEDLYQHGVASGDPLTDSVILWTRVTGGGESVDVWWEVAADPEFKTREKTGTFTTDASRDFTVKVDVTALMHVGGTYYYRFCALGRCSPIGRLKLAPVGEVDRARFAVMSCSRYPQGYFHAYRHIAERKDLDACVHLGDYIYEYGSKGFVSDRDHDPAHELVTLDDYRTRYAQYRTDPDLQAAHRQHAFVVVWDDHESANNSWRDGADNHTEGAEGSWPERKAAAIQAYYEWLPIRESETVGKIHRRFTYGSLCDLLMLDSRLWGRDQQVDPADAAGLADPEREMLGADQVKWLKEQLASSTAKWRLIGQQVMVSPLLAGGEVMNSDQWDGYPRARERFLELLGNDGDTVILTGDIHSSWANDVPGDTALYDPSSGAGSVAVEFVAPGITSGFPLGANLVDLAKQLNPWVRWANVTHRGYFMLDVNAERCQAAWYLIEEVTDPNATVEVGGVWKADYGVPHTVEDGAPAGERPDAPDLAP